ncbi:MAG TPA: glucoamylase family protein [Acidobacteriaceae bacterium]|nr:glucoamylase family protein [Acidobacteriaceae bacterium]
MDYPGKQFDRRSFLNGAAALAATSASWRPFWFARRYHDDALLEDLAERSFRYFQDAMDPQTGICRDLIHGIPEDNTRKGDEARGSTGVTGFCLTAMCIGAERNWIGRPEAKDRVRRTLRSYTNGTAECIHGWFYHFLDVHSGKRWKNSEVSTSDSIWLLAGALTCRQYFHEDSEIRDLATELYRRYDFVWMTNGDGKLLAHGWRPEGFIRFRYDKYCQLAAMVLLGIGSPTHALPADAWYAWERNPFSYGPYHYIGTSLLWTYQYPFSWFDFRGRRETRGTRVDWLENSQTATRAHRAWCSQELSRTFPDYTPEIWGITSSMSPTGYRAWGGPPMHSRVDGSVVPCAAGGSLMLTPDLCIPALHAMRERFGGRIWGKYGLADAFNPLTGWVATDTLGLDAGITLLSAENLRHGSVWHWFMENPEARKAMQLAGIEKQKRQDFLSR